MLFQAISTRWFRVIHRWCPGKLPEPWGGYQNFTETLRGLCIFTGIFLEKYHLSPTPTRNSEYLHAVWCRYNCHSPLYLQYCHTVTGRLQVQHDPCGHSCTLHYHINKCYLNIFQLKKEMRDLPDEKIEVTERKSRVSMEALVTFI